MVNDLYTEQEKYRRMVGTAKSEKKDIKKFMWIFPLVGILPLVLGGIEINGSLYLGSLGFFILVTITTLLIGGASMLGITSQLRHYENYGLYYKIYRRKADFELEERVEHFRPSINHGEPIGIYDERVHLDLDKFEELLGTYLTVNVKNI